MIKVKSNLFEVVIILFFIFEIVIGMNTIFLICAIMDSIAGKEVSYSIIVTIYIIAFIAFSFAVVISFFVCKKELIITKGKIFYEDRIYNVSDIYNIKYNAYKWYMIIFCIFFVNERNKGVIEIVFNNAEKIQIGLLYIDYIRMMTLLT